MKLIDVHKKLTWWDVGASRRQRNSKRAESAGHTPDASGRLERWSMLTSAATMFTPTCANKMSVNKMFLYQAIIN